MESHVGWTGSTRRLYQHSAPKGCAQHRKIQLEPQGVFQSLNRHCSTADGYYCPLLKLYYSIFLSVALLPANPPWRDGRHSHIKLFMTLASALFCRMKDKYNCDRGALQGLKLPSPVQAALPPSLESLTCPPWQNVQDQPLVEAKAFQRRGRMIWDEGAGAGCIRALVCTEVQIHCVTLHWVTWLPVFQLCYKID